MTSEDIEQNVGDWLERLDRADALFKAGNITGAAALAGAVEGEVETRRKRSAVGSVERRECMRVLKKARATLERLENTAGVDDDDEDD